MKNIVFAVFYTPPLTLALSALTPVSPYLLVSPPWMAVMSELQEQIQAMQSSLREGDVHPDVISCLSASCFALLPVKIIFEAHSLDNRDWVLQGRFGQSDTVSVWPFELVQLFYGHCRSEQTMLFSPRRPVEVQVSPWQASSPSASASERAFSVRAAAGQHQVRRNLTFSLG